MPWNRTDGLLYVTVLVIAYYAYHTIPDTLNHIRNLAACPEPPGPGPKRQLQKDAENAIAIDTIRTLSDGHSYSLRASTIRIVARRTTKSRTKKLLLEDLASTDANRRYDAICGLCMLISHPSLYGTRTREEFLSHESFKAIITALRNVLADHHSEQASEPVVENDPRYPEPQLPSSPVRPPVRPFHEQRLLTILIRLLDTVRPIEQCGRYPDNITCALHAGLITNWLKDYPFPCSLPQNSKFNFHKSDVYSLFQTQDWHHEDPDEMDLLMSIINRSALGRTQLVDAGLRKSTYTSVNELETLMRRWEHFPPRLERIDSTNDVRMINGESTAGAATPPPVARRRQRSPDDAVPLSRPQELSPEEENLRRRRREAIVIAEPGTAFSQHNILHRRRSD